MKTFSASWKRKKKHVKMVRNNYGVQWHAGRGLFSALAHPGRLDNGANTKLSCLNTGFTKTSRGTVLEVPGVPLTRPGMVLEAQHLQIDNKHEDNKQSDEMPPAAATLPYYTCQHHSILPVSHYLKLCWNNTAQPAIPNEVGQEEKKTAACWQTFEPQSLAD